MKVAICEDEEIMAQNLWKMLLEIADIDASYFLDPLELLKSYEKGERYHILFCDAAMKPMDGITLCRKIRRLDKNVYIVFVTNYIDYAPMGYEVGLFRYLLKPITVEALKKAINEIKDDIQNSSKILLKAPEYSILLAQQDILYIEAKDKESCVFYENDSIYIGKGLGELEKQLTSYGFFRIHRKYLVNLERIKEFDRYHLTLDNGRTLPVSKRKSSDFKKILYDFLGSRAGEWDWDRNRNGSRNGTGQIK